MPNRRVTSETAKSRDTPLPNGSIHVMRELFLVVAVASAANATPLIRAKPHAHASLTRDGAWLTFPSAEADMLAATQIEDEHGKRILIKTTIDDGWLELFLDPADVGTVTVAPTKLTVPGSHDVGAALGPGMLIDDAVADSHGISRVTIHLAFAETTIDLHGELPTKALGTRYEPPAKPEPEPKDDVELPPSCDLLDAPNGHAFASRHASTRGAATVISKRGAYTLVRLDGDLAGLSITGWLSTRLVTPMPPAKYGGAFVSIGGHDDPSISPRPLSVFDAREGTIIGELATRSLHREAAHVKQWVRYDLATQFGVAPVWAPGRFLAGDELVDEPRPDDNPPVTAPTPRRVLPPPLHTSVTTARVGGTFNRGLANAVIEHHLADMDRCYVDLPAGTITVHVTLGADGKAVVTSVEPAKPLRTMAPCVASAVAAIEFPKSPDGTSSRLTATYTFQPN